MIVKLLTEHYLELLSLKGGYTGSSESILVKIPHCSKSHVTAHLFRYMYGGLRGYCYNLMYYLMHTDESVLLLQHL